MVNRGITEAQRCHLSVLSFKESNYLALLVPLIHLDMIIARAQI